MRSEVVKELMMTYFHHTRHHGAMLFNVNKCRDKPTDSLVCRFPCVCGLMQVKGVGVKGRAEGYVCVCVSVCVGGKAHSIYTTTNKKVSVGR